MNQGFYGFPDRNNSSSASLVNDQTGTITTWDSVGIGKQLSIREDFASGSVPLDGTTPTSTAWYKSAASRAATANAGAITPYFLHFLPIYISRPVTIKQLLVYNGSPTIASNARIGVYDVDNIGLPKNLLYDSGSRAISSGSFAQTIIRNDAGLTPILKPGYYHIASIFDAASSIAIQNGGNILPTWWGNANTLWGTYNFWCIDNTSAATLIMPPQISKYQLTMFGTFSSPNKNFPEIAYAV
jgi:hypothetical protein